MARNLLHAGHELAVFNRSREKSQAFEAEGARVARSLAEASASVLILSSNCAIFVSYWAILIRISFSLPDKAATSVSFTLILSTH